MNGFDAFLLMISILLVVINLIIFADELTRKKRRLFHIRSIGLLCLGTGALAYHLFIDTSPGFIAWSLLTLALTMMTIVVSYLLWFAGRIKASDHH